MPCRHDLKYFAGEVAELAAQAMNYPSAAAMARDFASMDTLSQQALLGKAEGIKNVRCTMLK